MHRAASLRVLIIFLPLAQIAPPVLLKLRLYETVKEEQTYTNVLSLCELLRPFCYMVPCCTLNLEYCP